MRTTYEYLDARSLLIGENHLEELVRQAVDAERWADCDGCPAASVCPFKANRDDLAAGEGLQHLATVLTRAELLDGQVIVFREANALVSLLFSGCPNDYGDRNPCEWVQREAERGRWFSLLARRVHAVLFGSAETWGLEPSVSKGVQLDAVRTVFNLLDQDSAARSALEPVISGQYMSTDLGVERLVGPSGVIRELDPLLDPRCNPALDEHEADVFRSLGSDPRMRDGERRQGGDPGELLQSCVSVWEEMIEAVETKSDPASSQELYFWLRRWISRHLGHHAAVSKGITAGQPELDDYLAFLSSGEGTGRTSRRDLNRALSQLVAPASDPGSDGMEIRLGESMYLSGPWATAKLKPRFSAPENGASETLEVRVGELAFALPARSFAWFKKRATVKLSDLTFPPDLLDVLRRTLANAAAVSEYSVENDDIDIVVVTSTGERFVFERDNGELLSAEEA